MQTLHQWTLNHPLLMLLVLVFCTVVAALLYWTRSGPTSVRTHGSPPMPLSVTVDIPHYPRPVVIAGVDVTRAEDRRVPASGVPGVTGSFTAPAPPAKRVPMQSRFVPDAAGGGARSAALVYQILADQKVAHEEHGPEADAPAPGEKGYFPPSEYIPVTVGAYTVHLNRQSATSVSEARPDGAEWPTADVPEEWEPVIVALAMEVLRLREGWSVSDTDWTPEP